MDFIMGFLFNNLHWFWFAVMILCILLEAVTIPLISIWFALSALILIFISLLKLPFLLQSVIFFIIAAVLLIFTRPVFLKKMQKKTKTNIESLEGKEVPVTKKISKFEKGLVKINGLLWAADSLQNQEIPEGTVCKIVSIHGNTVTVEPVI